MTLNGWQRLYLVAILLWAVWLGGWTYVFLIDVPDDYVGDAIRSSALLWLLGAGALYVVGCGIAWTIRGFRKP